MPTAQQESFVLNTSHSYVYIYADRYIPHHTVHYNSTLRSESCIYSRGININDILDYEGENARAGNYLTSVYLNPSIYQELYNQYSRNRGTYSTSINQPGMASSSSRSSYINTTAATNTVTLASEGLLASGAALSGTTYNANSSMFVNLYEDYNRFWGSAGSSIGSVFKEMYADILKEPKIEIKCEEDYYKWLAGNRE